MSISSINPKEIEHFTKDSAHWWDESGPFAILHRLGPLRMRYIKDRIEAHFGHSPKGLKILDIGCGGGLICEPLSRMGATVTGIDADAQAVTVATEHAKKQGLKIDYHCNSIENHKGKYDVVLALEIIEHVADLRGFIDAATKLCKPKGLLIFSTLNRTPKSFALGIVAAEYILRWVPRGTHNWKQFLRPSKLAALLRGCDCEALDIRGYKFKPLSNEFEMSEKDISVNYFLSARKS